MSRLTSRRRWLMIGPWPHPKTGILYYRKTTPSDLLAARDHLAALGIKVSGEIQRSLKTKDQKPAERRYLEIANEVEADWERWRTLLRDGPKELSHKNVMALAGTDAADYVRQNSDNPQLAPGPHTVLAATIANLHAHYARQSLPKGQAVFEFGQELQSVPTGKLPSRLVEILAVEPAGPRREAAEAAARMLLDYRETFGWMRAKKITKGRGLTVTISSRTALGKARSDFQLKAWDTLNSYLRGDYSPPPWVGGLPAFELSAQPQAATSTSQSSGLSLEYLLDHKARTTNIRPKTVADNRTYLKKFAQFIGHDDARRVAKEDVRRWRDSLMKTNLSPKTISDKYLSAVRAVLSHGVKEFDLPFNAASGLADNRPVTASERSKAWSEEEALQILKATFGGSSKALSEPHKRALFWMPWMLAYTGLRASEVAQFRGRHLREENGIPYLLITPADGSTKSGKAWAVGIHKHLIDLGLLDFIRKVGDGPLFYEPYPTSIDPGSIKGRHRAADATKRVGDWITDEVGLEAPLGHPLHAFRHLFTTRSRACGMNKEARDFMMGSRSAADAREGYGDWPPSVLDAEINKLPRFAVEADGWRP
jgi:integrase